MNYTFIVLAGMITIFFVAEYIGKIINPDSSMSVGIIAAGLELVLGSFPSILDEIVGLLSFTLTGKPLDNDVNKWSLIAGIVLIIVGIYIWQYVRDRFYVLNLFGLYSRREISEKKNIKDLKLNDFKIRERIIDFVNVFKMGVDEQKNKIIINKISDECNKFKERSKEFDIGFTGTAPIPYTILAGTYLVDCDIKKYFEWNREQECFKSLLNTKKKKYDSLIIKEPDNKNSDLKSVIVAISTTKRVQMEQLRDFENQDVIEIYLENCRDNNIRYVSQLYEYRKTVLDELEKIGTDYPKLEQINLVASIPSCLSVEIGRMVAQNNNRVKKIVSYHFESQSEKLYPFGIVITESRGQYEKGAFVEN